MKIESIYRTEVFSVESNQSISEAASQMQFNEVSALVVFEEGRFIGIITERDVTRAVADGVNPEETPAGGYTTLDPVVVGPETDDHVAIAEMMALGVRHLPVLIGSAVVGMVSARDLLAEAVA
jgi:CBS domain-containing protein